MNNTIDITKLSITEIKAMAFDIINQINFFQNNLKVINEEIAKRPVETPVVEKPKVK